MNFKEFRSIHESGWHRRNPEKVGSSADPDTPVLKGSGKVKTYAQTKKENPPSDPKKGGIYKPNKAGKLVKVDEAKVDTGSAEDKATARNKRNTPPGKDSKFDTSVFITRKPGESLDSARTRKRRDAHAAKRGVSEAKVDTGDDVKKETDRNKRRFGRDAAPRGSGGVEYAQTLVRRREHRAKRGVKEDQAFDNVVAALRKKHGKDAVLTKDSPKPKSKPTAKTIQRKDNRSAAQREVDAQYGRTPWNKKGSLGT